MKKKIFGLREFVILAVIIIACYSIWPSIQVHTKSGEAKKTFVKENPKLAKLLYVAATRALHELFIIN